MSDQQLTNEQKLEEVYQIITKQESRRKTAMVMRFFKWIIIFGFLYLIATNPEAIMGKVTEMIKPLILSTASGMIESQKTELEKALQDMLPQ